MSPMFHASIAWIVDAVRARRRLVLVTIAVLALASAEGLRRLSFDADVLSLLPQSGRVTSAFREFLAENPQFAAERWLTFGRRGQAFVMHER